MYLKLYKLRLSYGFLIIIVIIIMFALYILDIATINLGIVRFKQTEIIRTFDVSTSACKIPYMDPFDKSVKNLIKYEQQICESKPKLVNANGTHLIVQENVFYAYNIKNVTCCYQHFWRIPPKLDQADRHVLYNKTKNCFSKIIKVNEEFVKVVCASNKQQVYVDFFAFVHVKEIPANRTNTSTADKLNILIIGMDAVSRLSFHRQMPRTKKFIENELGAIEFYGYNKVEDNTFPNVMPILTGQSIDEIWKSCWKPGINNRFDKCNFIWNNFHKAGYVTAFAEEMTFWGLFTNDKGGFINVPVMHYWETFGMELENEFVKGTLYKKKCNRFMQTTEYLLDYVLSFVRSYRNNQSNYFGFFWESIITHETINYDPKLDDLFLRLFEDLNNDNNFNDSIVFFMSDHGSRFGKITETYQGRMEERLPLFYVIVPKWFKTKFPAVVENLKNNSRLLTSHFDLHATLESIMNEDYSTGESYKRGISLFKQIPQNRTCESAGIPAHWCTCKPMVPVAVTNNTVKYVTNFALEIMMSRLKEETNCITLTIDKIIDARVLDEDFQKGKNRLIIYNVNFKTNPGGGLFEATVQCKKCEHDFEMAGSIARHNLYGNQSHCVHDSIKKLFS